MIVFIVRQNQIVMSIISLLNNQVVAPLITLEREMTVSLRPVVSRPLFDLSCFKKLLILT